MRAFPAYRTNLTLPTVLNAYGPTHLLKTVSLDASSSSLVFEYFRYGMQHPVMFEALIAASHCHLMIHSWRQNQPDRTSMHHYGSALNRLRDILLQPDGFRDDAILFAILALLDVEVSEMSFLQGDRLVEFSQYLLGDVDAYEVHIRGLYQVITLRGGLNSLDRPNVLTPAIIGYVCSRRTMLSSEY